MTAKKYIHPNANPDLLKMDRQELRETQSKEEIADFVNPILVPGLEAYLLPNDGRDATPVKVEVQTGMVHEPDGTPRGPGDTMIMPKYVADPWIQEGRVKRVR